MLVHFWGVRGSLAAPLSPLVIKEKIAAIIEQAMPEDFVDAESKRRFLAGLPPWLYGTVGGNSPCISIDIDGFNEPFIFDCGSGIREMGIHSDAMKPVPSRYHIFFSHFHMDHLLGFPFFTPAYNPSITVDFYSPKPNLKKTLAAITVSPFFPVQLDYSKSKKIFHLLENNDLNKAAVSIGPVEVDFKKMNHPGDSFSYKLTCNGKRFIYATDVELSDSDVLPNEENTRFFKDADMIVLDSQYTPDEAIDKYNWGHSAFNIAVDFAANWGIKHLILFHHDPAYDDRKLHEILQLARRHLQNIGAKDMEINLAVEGLEISL
jgi:phosphoribosyl 1,2-cyclic phosphodiesterase